MFDDRYPNLWAGQDDLTYDDCVVKERQVLASYSEISSLQERHVQLWVFDGDILQMKTAPGKKGDAKNVDRISDGIAHGFSEAQLNLR